MSLEENESFGYNCSANFKICVEYYKNDSSRKTQESLEMFLGHLPDLQHEYEHVVSNDEDEESFVNFQVVKRLPPAKLNRAYVAVIPNDTTVYCINGVSCYLNYSKLNPMTLILCGKFLEQ